MSFTNAIDAAYSATRMTAEQERKAAMQNVCAVHGCDATRNLYSCDLHPTAGKCWKCRNATVLGKPCGVCRAANPEPLFCEMHTSVVMINGHERILCRKCEGKL